MCSPLLAFQVQNDNPHIGGLNKKWPAESMLPGLRWARILYPGINMTNARIVYIQQTVREPFSSSFAHRKQRPTGVL